jgi:nitroreductase
MLEELLKKSRSYRRFRQDIRIQRGELEELVNLTRFAPSTVNSQPLKYRIVTDEKECELVFGTLGWAGLLKGKGTPREGEKPAAYIIILCDLAVGRNKQLDCGICAQTIMLGAAEKGIGGCMLGSINRGELASRLNIDTEKYSIDLCLAFGIPAEQVKLVDVGPDGSTAYYRDENDVHCVPKRSLEDILID